LSTVPGTSPGVAKVRGWLDSGWWLGGIQYNRAIKFTYKL